MQHDSERQLRHMPRREKREGELSRSASEKGAVPQGRSVHRRKCEPSRGWSSACSSWKHCRWVSFRTLVSPINVAVSPPRVGQH